MTDSHPETATLNRGIDTHGSPLRPRSKPVPSGHESDVRPKRSPRGRWSESNFGDTQQGSDPGLCGTVTGRERDSFPRANAKSAQQRRRRGSSAPRSVSPRRSSPPKSPRRPREVEDASVQGVDHVRVETISKKGIGSPGRSQFDFVKDSLDLSRDTSHKPQSSLGRFRVRSQRESQHENHRWSTGSPIPEEIVTVDVEARETTPASVQSGQTFASDSQTTLALPSGNLVSLSVAPGLSNVVLLAWSAVQSNDALHYIVIDSTNIKVQGCMEKVTWETKMKCRVWIGGVEERVCPSTEFRGCSVVLDMHALRLKTDTWTVLLGGGNATWYDLNNLQMVIEGAISSARILAQESRPKEEDRRRSTFVDKLRALWGRKGLSSSPHRPPSSI
ncbi:hypothetical protein M427DRAFT_140183 [Gonapodya prolifera JEL478]|uniref:Uncharacterized protein n=1 Tax=Gonapodya prolifera (strain JEL478) TaxID=1344416 RepID=A0A138ZZN4_GONPJ|nr:hypothetical protein M427DRAFT_140183 [Gonapodya prolifera JEL478]|eukprot:KXS09966.1 hypothetical protein M427DRAFT_140183 [Gonapodya prolifera JEL478]